MRRKHAFEFSDRAWCPAVLRDAATDILRFTSVKTNMYAPILPHLKSVLCLLDCHDIVDLCSGGTGPVLLIQEQLASREDYPVRVTLTDKFPNLAVFQAAAAAERVNYLPDPVDACDVPEGLRGFRTLFASFHHFRPDEAKRILEDASAKREGIGVFEFTGRNPGIFLVMLLSPLYVLLATPFIKPFSWRKAFLTYAIPLIPLAACWDGIASNLRTYSPAELEELVKGLDVEGYRWDIGRLRGSWDLWRIHGIGLHKITYLLGYPLARG